MEYQPPLQFNQFKTVFRVEDYDYQDSYTSYYTANNLYAKLLGNNLFTGENSFDGDVYVSNDFTAFESSINNNLAVGATLSTIKLNVASDITSSGNLLIQNVSCNSLTVNSNAKINGTLNYKNQPCCFLSVQNTLIITSPYITVPFIKSITNTSSCFTNLDLNTILGNSGNSASITLLPNYTIRFFNSNTQLFYLDNKTGTDVLYSTVGFSQTLNCTKILIYLNGLQI